MKNIIKICLATTGLSLIFVSLVATFYRANFLCIATVYQILLSNIVIHLGLMLLQRFESKYCIIETLVDIAYVLLVLILFGIWFNWYSSTPLGILIVIGVATYILGSFIDLYRVTTHVTFINQQLKLHNEKSHSS